MRAKLLIVGILGGALAASAARARTVADESSNHAAMASAREAAKGDVVLESLLAELERSKAQLKMDQVQAPYYIEYRVSDISGYAAEAAFGALNQDQNVHVRFLRVVVRVGDYKQDSYFGPGTGASSILPLDDDPIAIRHQIWLATDAAYKAAGEALTEKQAYLKQFAADDHPVDDFSKAPPVIAIEPLVSLQADENTWRETLRQATNLFRDYPGIESVAAAARFSAINEYFVNSEGTVTRSGKTVYSVQVESSAQAPDGMRVNRSPAWTVARVSELPTREAFLKDARATLDTVQALQKAPIVEEEYRGPVLLAPDAACDVIAAFIGANVTGRKPQPGKPNRTVGAFASSYKSRVLPSFASVIDDPTMKEFEGQSLIGSYDVDSEGVKAQRVDVVDAGNLENYLVGREPIRDFPASNGHGRSAPGGSPVASTGVLIFKTNDPQPPQALQQKILQMAKDQERPYVYRVETLGPVTTPRLLYRVYAKDGHQELVRGAVFSELDVRALRTDLSAAGNDPLVSNRLGGAPTTVISPSLLFDEMEVKRADTGKDKLPDYPAPPLEKK
jgi:hypothetical protein